MVLEPCTLTGKSVRLEPLTLSHVDQLAAAALHPELWLWTQSAVRTRSDLQQYIADALSAQDAGKALPFVTIDRATNQVVGSTRYYSTDCAHRRVEIGWTFLTPAFQRTAINTEAKYLMLRHAFEVLGCIRVEFKTDVLNAKSRAALLRLGATEEGIFRQHMIVHGGRFRDSVYFSIIDSEWPAVAARLQGLLARA